MLDELRGVAALAVSSSCPEASGVSASKFDKVF
jgi:hypothetical protein